MRPNFLTNPRARWVQALRRHQSATDYACPVVIHTRSRWRLSDIAVIVLTLVACVATGVILAWRG
jgi:hypothetical protein